MKTLLLMRHAKSSWDDPDLADHDRPLNKRGKREAPRMGRWLARQDFVPELIVSSTAERARATAEKLAQACEYRGEITHSEGLYHASPASWYEVLRGLPETATRVLCVGHNPELEEVLHALSGGRSRMPTAAIAHLELPVDRWCGLTPQLRATLHAVWRPKEIDLPEDE
jgi:phosphohistidine phosphatase